MIEKEKKRTPPKEGKKQLSPSAHDPGKNVFGGEGKIGSREDANTSGLPSSDGFNTRKREGAGELAVLSSRWEGRL